MSDFTKPKTVIDNVTLDDSPTSTTSASVKCEGYSRFMLFLDVDSTLAPTDVLFEVELSPDGTNWHKYVIGPFGDLRYEDTLTASGLLESLSGECAGATHWRIKATGTGTDASNSFAITAKVAFYN